MKTKLRILSRRTPGSPLSPIGQADNLDEALRLAGRFVAGRRDLCYQDVEIRCLTSDRRIAFAGPAR